MGVSEQSRTPVAVRNRVRELRRERGLTLQAVATAVGAYPMTILRIEDHRRGVSDRMRLRLARFFAVPVQELFRFEDVLSSGERTGAA